MAADPGRWEPPFERSNVLRSSISGSFPMAAGTRGHEPSSERRIGDTSRIAMRTIDLQRRLISARADELLDRLQGSVPEDRRGGWDESGHARINLGHERDDAREYVAEQLHALSDEWTEHIAIL